MRLTVERSGGFAGIVKAASVDTGRLPERVAKQIEALLAKLDLAALAKTAVKKARQADRFVYRIVVEGDGPKLEMTLAEPDLPEALKQCIDLLLRHDS